MTLSSLPAFVKPLAAMVAVATVVGGGLLGLDALSDGDDQAEQGPGQSVSGAAARVVAPLPPDATSEALRVLGNDPHVQYCRTAIERGVVGEIEEMAAAQVAGVVGSSALTLREANATGQLLREQLRRGEWHSALFTLNVQAYTAIGVLPGLKTVGAVGVPATRCMEALVVYLNMTGAKAGQALRDRMPPSLDAVPLDPEQFDGIPVDLGRVAPVGPDPGVAPVERAPQPDPVQSRRPDRVEPEPEPEPSSCGDGAAPGEGTYRVDCPGDGSPPSDENDTSIQPYPDEGGDGLQVEDECLGGVQNHHCVRDGVVPPP